LIALKKNNQDTIGFIEALGSQLLQINTQLIPGVVKKQQQHG
jgi:hypothetical protein